MNKLELNHNFATNIEIERSRLGLTQKEMAERLELSLSSYKNIINGACLNVGIYTAYLCYKVTGKMLFELCDCNLEGYDTVKKLRELSDNQKKFVDGIIDFEREFRAPSKGDDYITVLCPTGDVYDGMIWDSFSLSKIEVSAYRKKFHFDCGVKVTSNHLHPTYIAGDVLLVALKPPRNGDVGIFINKASNRAYLRRYVQTEPVRLEPINNFGQTFLVNPKSEVEMSEWIKFGIVVSKVR